MESGGLWEPPKVKSIPFFPLPRISTGERKKENLALDRFATDAWTEPAFGSGVPGDLSQVRRRSSAGSLGPLRSTVFLVVPTLLHGAERT